MKGLTNPLELTPFFIFFFSLPYNNFSDKMPPEFKLNVFIEEMKACKPPYRKVSPFFISVSSKKTLLLKVKPLRI